MHRCPRARRARRLRSVRGSTISPVDVKCCVSRPMTRAMPKSSSFTWSLPTRVFPIMMLSGFRSRCRIPSEWAAASASAVWLTMSEARMWLMTRSRSRIFVSASPATNSIARNTRPSDVSPKSYTAATLGCEIWLAFSASRWNRPIAAGSLVSHFRMTFTATLRFIRTCSAR